MENSSRSRLVPSESQKLKEELRKLGLKIKHHEDNLKFLKSQIDQAEESTLDLRMSLANYYTSASAVANNDTSAQEAEMRTVQSILNCDNTAAGIICKVKVHHGQHAAKSPVTRAVLGVVANLGKVNNEDLSRMFSEYLGLENMLGLVCTTYEGVKALEKYGKEGRIDKRCGVHGLGQSIGRSLEGRFTVFCLENIRPFAGEVVRDDPQRKLVLHEPRLPNGEYPPGYMGFAVNMIHLDHMHLKYLTASGHGLRDTLFYSLFSGLQVYKTRADLQRAISCISDGAISLDGGIMRSNGSFSLGYRQDVEVKFPVSLNVPNLPPNIIEMEEQVKLLNWQKERLLDDFRREEELLSQAKNLFTIQKQRTISPKISIATGRPSHAYSRDKGLDQEGRSNGQADKEMEIEKGVLEGAQFSEYGACKNKAESEDRRWVFAEPIALGNEGACKNKAESEDRRWVFAEPIALGNEGARETKAEPKDRR